MEAAKDGRKDGTRERAPKDGTTRKEAAKVKGGAQEDTVPKEKGKECKEHVKTVGRVVTRPDCVHNQQNGIQEGEISKVREKKKV